MDYVAFFGTGPCDPNKDLKQNLVAIGVVVGWTILAKILGKLSKSDRTRTKKTVLSLLIVVMALIVTVAVALFTWIGLICSSYR